MNTDKQPPPLPGLHGRPTMKWSDMEREAILAYGDARVAHALAQRADDLTAAWLAGAQEERRRQEVRPAQQGQQRGEPVGLTDAQVTTLAIVALALESIADSSGTINDATKIARGAHIRLTTLIKCLDIAATTRARPVAAGWSDEQVMEFGALCVMNRRSDKTAREFFAEFAQAHAHATPQADDVRDAARYRWLRDSKRIPRGDDCGGHIVVCAAGGEDVLWGKGLDTAIDRAMHAATPPDEAGKS